MTRHARKRLRIALAVIFCLLFQQVAMAAYACTRAQMPEPVTAGHCEQMGMAQQQDNPVLCEKHCNPDRVLTADAAKLSVLPLALPPVAFGPVLVAPFSHATVQAEASIVRSDPPPRLRYCSLLI